MAAESMALGVILPPPFNISWLNISNKINIIWVNW